MNNGDADADADVSRRPHKTVARCVAMRAINVASVYDQH